MTRDILIKFLNNNCTEAELNEVLDWVKTGALTENGKKLGFEDWENYHDERTWENDEKFIELFDKIQKKIDNNNKEHKTGETKTFRLSVFVKYLTRVAAILLIPVLTFSIWYYISTENSNQSHHLAQSWVEINAPDGARVQFTLPDSSSGWLNSGSKLKYPVLFTQNRKVELQGEAWFNVKHLNQSEFVVGVSDMDIKVLGTKFNVSAYADDAFTDVILNEGKVEVIGKVGTFNATLLPNEKISFNREARQLKESKVDANRYSAWKDGYLIIEDEPLGQIVGRIERWYNVQITIEDEVLKNYRFKATFKDEPLEEVLRLMAKTTPIKYNVEKRVVDSNGVLKLKKVTIKLK